MLERLDHLVLKPVDGSGGKGLVIGPHASDETLAELRIQVEREPRAWIAQRVVALSTVPTFVGDRFRPRHADLRPFAVNDGERIWVLPGGLTRVALPEGKLVVNSSQGGGSKDTWVLADAPVARQQQINEADVAVASLIDAQPAPFGEAPDHGPTPTWSDQQQQQQQLQQQRQQ